ncbi:MAG: hypothetical protein K9M97_01670 [Akkermansiaceae bacterium]|nr:hypothetical protein [Akkermansiaceae bacterium]
MYRRSLTDRLLDRLWVGYGNWRERRSPSAQHGQGSQTSSVSGTLGWPGACAALADGTITTQAFRQRREVREVVETLGLADGRYFADWIRSLHPAWLVDQDVDRVNQWGNPIRAAGCLLGGGHAFSPTSLRYLAHALWLKQSGLITPAGTVVEIGVGFGGLAAMNALVSKAATLLVDLPEVATAAALMMGENGLGAYVMAAAPVVDYCLISNYAFTEMSEALQSEYFERYIRGAERGAIISNAAVFAKGIGGRTDEDLVAWFRAEGVPAVADRNCEILGPADHLCGVTLIRWDRCQTSGLPEEH